MFTAEEILNEIEGTDVDAAVVCLNRADLVSHFETKLGPRAVEVFVFEDGSSLNVFPTGRVTAAKPF